LENYYNVLGVSENATQEEIKKAFRQKSKEHHPDRGGNEEEFKKINEAYSAIGDEQKRAEYDNQKNNPFANMGGNPFGGDPFDIFANMFGGGRQQRRAPDKVMEIKIGAVDSFLGKQVDIPFTRKTNCGSCDGKGGDRISCAHCGGAGYTSQRVGNGFFQNIFQSPCNHCSGRGFNFKTTCGICNGEGKVNESQKITMTLPVGISDGQMVRAGRMGDFHDGMFGDLILKVLIVPQDGFEKSAGDLIFTKYLSVNELDMDELKIPHPHGELTIKMPEMFDSSKPLKVGGKGYSNEIGDFYIKLHVRHKRKVAV
jgi:molecular chaperone DnaJ